MFRNTLLILVIVVSSIFILNISRAQVVREDSVQGVAGVLGPENKFDEFTFDSQGNEIIFATIEGDIYQTMGRTEEHEAEDPGGGCSEEGGPGGFCLQVLDLDDNVLCWADRPVRPGWQRDPRLACPLMTSESSDSRGKKPETYRLRVFWRPEMENPCMVAEENYGNPGEKLRPYILELSLRKIAPEGNIRTAIGQSFNQF